MGNPSGDKIPHDATARGCAISRFYSPSTWIEGEARLTVQYSGALDWFTVEGSPVPAADEHTAREVHQRMVEGMKAGGGATAPVG